MGLSWRQNPIAPGAVGRFPVPAPLPERMQQPGKATDEFVNPQDADRRVAVGAATGGPS